MDEPSAGLSQIPMGVTELLQAHQAGEDGALNRLAPVVYEELKRIAHRQLGRENANLTLQTTGLVHEAFVKLVGLDRIRLNDREHFFALSARLMRQILLDSAKRRSALKRGGGRSPITLRDSDAPEERVDPDQILALDEALHRLAAASERQARVVECRFFAGMSIEETAGALGIAKATVKRDWQLARAWLNRELS